MFFWLSFDYVWLSLRELKHPIYNSLCERILERVARVLCLPNPPLSSVSLIYFIFTPTWMGH